ncbi:cache domain-containing sensor histidine kinase [Aquibacillus albus]|uniref:Sensor histidine kinase YesM n=1 Tax=Aquibacillus albus TaxID=1168171 RepID=A0ABS2N1B8_9BACI|nr:sensor histidine kinase [Aquibacillus albus]MBM7571933.1 sensor histidine kinase YesM [Aquibacillus albus]
MKNLLKIIQNNNLFVKMFLVMVISIVSVSVLITFSTIRMSSNLFMETFSITNTKVLNQIKQRLEAFNYSVVVTAIDVQNNGTVKEVLTQKDGSSLQMNTSFYSIKEEMERIYNDNSTDANMILLGVNYHLFNMKYSNWPVTADTLVNHPMTVKTRENPNKILYQFDWSEATNGVPMIVATKVLTERSTGNIYGYLYVPIREQNFREFYEGYTSQGNNVLVMNSDGRIISSNQLEMIGENALNLLSYTSEIEDNNLDHKEVNVFEKDYLMLSEYLPTLDLYIVNLINKDLVIDNLVDTKEIVLISIGIVLLAVLVVFIISRRMTVSLSKLINQISNMARYNFSKPVQVTGGYEARKMASAFNYMLNELHEYVNILMKTQQKQRKAELEALQHQINPHFLYNTLTSIKFLVKEGKKESAFDTIDALISLLQNALGNVDETISVEQEIVNMKNYVLINQTRYGDRIKVNYLISPDCLQYHLPKLVIQPFIENAFFHAFTHKKHGYIQILIAQRENNLVCEVIDTGDGIAVDKTEKKLPYLKEKRQLFSGIGVRNVNERIQLLYGKDYGVEITSELGKGTKVKITLPLMK